MSELRARARPHPKRFDDTGPSGGYEGALESQAKGTAMFRDLLSVMIDERLKLAELQSLKIVVAPGEIDAAIQGIASRLGISVAEVHAEAGKQGLNEKEHREEVRRQLIDAKFVDACVKPRLHFSMIPQLEKWKRLDAEKRKVLEELRAERFIEVRL